MCARYTAIKDLTAIIAQVMCLNRIAQWSSRFNIAPKQMAPVITQAQDQRELRLMRWGLIPAWAKDEGIGSQLINARSETLADKPSFQSAFKKRRCLVPADGFYEWLASPSGKIPHRFALRSDEWFCFAGLWEAWRAPRPPQGDLFSAPEQPAPILETFTIITTAANELVRPLHERMPVILSAADYDQWLDPGASIAALQGLLQPAPPETLTRTRVSRYVNNPRNEGPACLERENAC